MSTSNVAPAPDLVYMGIRGSQGRRIFLDKPQPSDFEPESIARSLAHEHRYAGNYGSYSVAQHAVLVARVIQKGLRGLPPQILAGLHHDDSEAITGDLPRPVKQWLRQHTNAFDVLESSLMAAVEQRYRINCSDPLVKKADHLVYHWEVKRLVPADARWMYEPLPPAEGIVLPNQWFVPWTAEQAYAEYMDMHERLTFVIENADVTEHFTEHAN